MTRLARPLTLVAAAGLLALSTLAAQAQGAPTGAKRGYQAGDRVGGPLVGGAGAVVGGVAGAAFGVVGADPGRCAYGACKKRHYAKKRPVKSHTVSSTVTRGAPGTPGASTTTTTTTTSTPNP